LYVLVLAGFAFCVIVCMRLPTVTPGQKVILYGVKAWDWAQWLAFYGAVPAIVYYGAKKSGFTSLSDLKPAFQIPLL
jgi:hypothetical protein